MGSKCCKCTSDKTTSPQRSSSTYSYPRSRTRKRMIGDDWEVEEHIEDERFSPHKSGGTRVSSDRPILSRSLTDITVKVGTRTRFLIEVSSPTPVTVRWEKNGKTVEDTDRLKLATEGQFYCLDISPVVLEDSGSWTVWVKNSIGVTRSSAELSLIVPKAYKKPEFVEPLRAVLTAQGTVSLECKVVGVPTPTLRWLKGNSEIKAGDILALTADASDPTSLGTYTCLASNCMGKAESTSIVHLNGSSSTAGFLPSGPKPKFLKELRNEKVKLGGHVTLECKISVPPWPEEIHWYGPSGEVVEGERAHLIEDGAGMYSITLPNVTSEDNGTWKCVATNKLGAKSVSTANLTVNYPKNYRKPKFLESLKAILTEEGLVSFECKVVGYPTPNLSWLKDGKELKPGDVYQLTGTNSLGSYCCIAQNCMGQAESSAELTLEDIKSQLTEEERLQLSSEKLPPRFIQGLKSSEAKINESFKFTVQVSVFPESTVLWFKDDEIVEKSEKYKLDKDRIGTFHLEINKLEFSDQAEWKCVATNDFGQSVTSCFLKLNIPRHYKKPKFLEDLKAVMSDEGAVNLECKVIGVPQPKLKWFKDGRELKAGDIHKIISGQDGTCCLGTYTCLAQNCMGTVSSSASLLGFEEKGVKSAGIPESIKGHPLSRDRSLSTIHEERTSQLHDTEKSTTIDDRAEEVSFSFDGKEVSVSLYETPDLTEEEALQIVEMYADQISEHVSEHNLVELPPMRFTKESSTSGKLMMEALVIDVNPEYFTTAPTSPKVVEDDLRTDADVDEFSLVEEITMANLTPDEVKTTENIAAEFEARTPLKPPRNKNKSHYKEDEKDISEGNEKANAPEAKPRKKKISTDSEREDDSLQEFERRKILEKQVISKPEKKRTDSELEDDSLYEFENRKTKEDDIKAFQKENIRQSTQETVFGRTVDNETSITNVKSIEPFVSKRSITEDEATFNTAEESAFERSEVSVLESLAHSLTEIQKGLVAVEAHVASESSAEMHSAHGLFESLVQPITDVQKSLEIVEAHLSDTPAGQPSTEMLETLIQPIEQFKKNLALMQELNLPVLQSVTCQLDNLDKEIAQIRQTTRSHQEYKKSVTEVQEALSKIIERQSCVPSDKNISSTLTAELHQLEENANDELEKYYDRLLNVSTEIRTKANHEEDQEISDILRSVGDLIKPLKKLSAITSRCIAVIVEDNEMGIPPTAKVVEALVKPLEVTNASLRLFESISTLKSHKAIRGTGIPVLYKVSVPMDELDTTINLVENLSAHTAVEFLIPPLENLEKIVKDIDISHGGSGFLENLQMEGVPLVKNLEHSLDVMLDCIGSIQKGVPVDESKRDIAGKLPAITKPMEDLYKSLKSVENGIKSGELSYGEVFSIAQELSKPLQTIRSEFSILQHEIEADHYSTEQPCQNALINLVEPLEGVQNCITAFHETVMCKSGDDPMHMRFILYALKEMAEPLDNLCSKMITAEETLLGKGDPFQGLKAVTRSVSELRESSAAAVSSESNAMEKISIMLSEPLTRVQSGLENILELVDKKENVNVDVMKDMTGPFKELQSALLEIDEQMNEEVTEGATPELKNAIQDLLKTITVMPNRSALARTDEPTVMESNMVTLQSLTQPLQTLKAQFAEIQRSSNRTLIKADIALSSLGDSARRVSATLTELKNVSPQPVSEVLCSLGIVIEDFEATLEDLSTNLETTKKLDEARRNLSDSLKIIDEKLSKMYCKMETYAVSVDPGKPKPMVLVKDVMLNLQRAIEQSYMVLSNGKGNAANRNNDTLNTIDQLANAFTTFHCQLISIDEVAVYIRGEPRGVNALKEHVDELESLLKDALSYEIQDKNDEMVLDSISNDIKSVQRVVDNLVLEGNADTARVRFVLAKVESVYEDLKHLSKNHDNQNNFKVACQTSLSILNIGEDLLVPKPKKTIEIVPKISKGETSVIGNLLEGIEELESSFEKMKQKAKANGISDKAIAEMSLELSILQSTVQDLATEASGDLLDKAQELCIPIKAIQEHLLQVPRIKQIDIEESSESLHNINRVLTAVIKKKEVEKLAQPLTSVIGDLLETVDELEVSFDKQKHKAEWKMVEEESVSKMASEIFILQGIVQDLATEATGDLLDKASKACLPVKMLEETLVTSTRNSGDLEQLCEALHNINMELRSAIKQSELEKALKEKEFEKLFSFEALSADLDLPIIKSIVSTVRSMQSELQTVSSNPEKNHLREFLQNFEQNLIVYGDAIENRRNGQELLSSLNKMESMVSKFDVNCLESEYLSQAIADLKNALDDDSMRNVLPGFQTILTQLKTLHEELKRTISPAQDKKREAKCLEWFSKASAELERGLMKLEKAILINKNRQVDCMLSPMENLVSFINTITDKTNIEEFLEEGSLSSLESLSKPIGDIQGALSQIQDAIENNDDVKALELLVEIANPVRELRANIALIQDKPLTESSLSQLCELKQAVSVMANQAAEEAEILKKPLLQLQARLQELNPESELEEVVSEITEPVDSLKQAVENLESCGESSTLLELCHQVVDIISMADETLSEISTLGQFTQGSPHVERTDFMKIATECQEIYEDNTLSEISISDRPTQALEGHTPALVMGSIKKENIQQDKGEFQHERFEKGIEALKHKIEDLKYESQSSQPEKAVKKNSEEHITKLQHNDEQEANTLGEIEKKKKKEEEKNTKDLVDQKKEEKEKEENKNKELEGMEKKTREEEKNKANDLAAMEKKQTEEKEMKGKESADIEKKKKEKEENKANELPEQEKKKKHIDKKNANELAELEKEKKEVDETKAKELADQEKKEKEEKKAKELAEQKEKQKEEEDKKAKELAHVEKKKKEEEEKKVKQSAELDKKKKEEEEKKTKELAEIEKKKKEGEEKKAKELPAVDKKKKEEEEKKTKELSEIEKKRKEEEEKKAKQSAEEEKKKKEEEEKKTKEFAEKENKKMEEEEKKVKELVETEKKKKLKELAEQEKKKKEEEEMKTKELAEIEKKKKEEEEKKAKELAETEKKKKEEEEKKAKELEEMGKKKKKEDEKMGQELAEQEEKKKEEEQIKAEQLTEQEKKKTGEEENKVKELAEMEKKKKEEEVQKVKVLEKNEKEVKEERKIKGLEEQEKEKKVEEKTVKELAEIKKKKLEEEEKKAKQLADQKKKKVEEEGKNAKELAEIEKTTKENEEKKAKASTEEQRKKKEEEQKKADHLAQMENKKKEKEEQKAEKLAEQEKKKKVEEEKKEQELVDQERKKNEEEEKKAKELAEEQRKKKEEEEKKVKELAEQEKKKKEEEENKAKELAEQEKKKKKQEEKKAKKLDEEQRKKKEEEEKKAKELAEQEKKKKEEEEEKKAKELAEEQRKKKEEEEKKAKELAEQEKKKKEEEEEKKAKELAEEQRKKKEEEEKKVKELAEQEKKKKEEEEKKAKELADEQRKKKEEEEKKAKELAEQEKKKKKEEEKKAKELAEEQRKKKEEEEKKAKELAEQEKKKKEEEEEKKAKELAEEQRKKKEEEEKKAKELAEEQRKKKEEEEKKAKELAEQEKKKKEEEEEKKAKELAEEQRKKKEEEEKKAKELAEQEKKKKEEEEKKAKELAEEQRKKKEEEEKKAKELAEQEKKKKEEEEEKKAKELAEEQRKKKEEEEKKAKELAEQEKKKKEEEEEKKAKELAEEQRKKKEEEEKKAKELAEQEKKKKEEEEEEKKAKELAEQEKKKKEEAEKKAKELAEQEKKKKEEEKKAKELAEEQRKKKEEEEKKVKELAEQEKKKKEEEEEKKAKELAEEQRKKKEDEEMKAKVLAEQEKKKKEKEEQKAKELAEQEKKKKEEEKKAKELAEEQRKKKENEEMKAIELAEQEKKKKEQEEKKAKELAEEQRKKKEEEEKKAKELAEEQRKKKEEEEKKADHLTQMEKKKKEKEEMKAKELAAQEKKKKEKEEQKTKELAEQDKKKKDEEETKAQELADQKKKKNEEEKKAKELSEEQRIKKEEKEKKADHLAQMEKKKKEEEEMKAKELAAMAEKKKEEEEKKAQTLADMAEKKKEEEEKKVNELADMAEKKKEKEEKKAKELAEMGKKKKEQDENNTKALAEQEKKRKEEREKQTKQYDKNKKKRKEDEVKKAKEEEIPENEKKQIEEVKEFIVKKKQNKEEEDTNVKPEQGVEMEVKQLSEKGKNKVQEEDYKSSETVEQINAKRKKRSIEDVTDQEKKKYLNNQMNVEKLYEPENKILDGQFCSTDQTTVDMTTIEDDTTRKRCNYNNLIQYAASGKSGQSLRETKYYNNRGIEVVELPDYEPPVRPERGRRTYGSMRDAARMQEVQETQMSSYSWKKSQERSWTHLEYSASDLQRPAPFHTSRRTLSPRKDFSSMQLDSIRYQPTPHYERTRRSVSPLVEHVSPSAYGSTLSLTTRRHIDELTAARLRPPTLSTSLTSLRSRSITRLEQVGKRAYICNGLLDKTVIHGGKIRLTCNIGGDSNPTIEWHKDGRPISLHTDSARYNTDWNYGVASLEIPNALTSDSGQYTCIVKNTNGQQATTSTVRVISKKDGEDSEWNPIEPEYEVDVPREVCLLVKGADIGMPRVTNLLADPVVPSGSTIALHVQVAGCTRPDITWLRGGAPLPKYSPRVHYFEDGGLFTLLLEGATPSESGVYTCRISSGRRGAVDTTAMVQVVQRRPHEKPARFTVKPESWMTLTNGEDMTLTCYVSGEPKPQVTFMKGIKDISKSCRTLKESFGEYVRLTLKRINLDDRGTYFIVAKNIYGTDRAFVTLQIRDRARSHTPTSWSEAKDSFSMLFNETHYNATHRSTTALTHHEPLQM